MVPADPVALGISGTLDMELGDSIMVFTPAATFTVLLFIDRSPEHAVELCGVPYAVNNTPVLLLLLLPCNE